LLLPSTDEQILFGCIPKGKFLLLFWNLLFAHAEGQSGFEKEDLMKSVLGNICDQGAFYIT
jgi:hypothetical protein